MAGIPINSNATNGASEVYVARGGQLLGSIRIADVLRPEAKSAAAAMRAMGMKTVLLSGDSKGVTAIVGGRGLMVATPMCAAPPLIIPSTEARTPRTAETSRPSESRADGNA